MKASEREIKFKKIQEKVQKQGGFLTLYMRDLREAYGVAKLGQHVVTSIDRELRAVGLGHVNDLTESQWDNVRLYQKGHPAEDLVNAFNSINVEEKKGDQYLISCCQSKNSSDYRQAIINIRDIVNSVPIDYDE